MHFSSTQIVLLCAGFLMIGVFSGYWRGYMALAKSLILRSRDSSLYKLGDDYVCVMQEDAYNRMARKALQWELSEPERSGVMNAEQAKSKQAYEKIRALSWHDINMDMMARVRELMRWMKSSGEPLGDMQAAWLAWECTQAAWHHIGMETGLYPINTQRWDGNTRSPFCTEMEQRRREEQDRTIKAMGPIADDHLGPRRLEALLREEFAKEGEDITKIYTLPDPGMNSSHSGEGPGVTPTRPMEASAADKLVYFDDKGNVFVLDNGGSMVEKKKAPIVQATHAGWAEQSPKVDPSQELDDRIQEFNNRNVKAVLEPDSLPAESFDMPEDRPLESSSDPDARSRDPYGSSVLNEDVSGDISNPTDYGLDLGKVHRATEPGSFAGAPKDLPDTLHGNWFVISQAGDFFGPFDDRTQANEKANGSSLAAWSLGQSSPSEFLALCRQGKGFPVMAIPDATHGPLWYMHWSNSFGHRIAGPYADNEGALKCGNAMDLPFWDTMRLDGGPGMLLFPSIYFFDKSWTQQLGVGPVGSPCNAETVWADQDDAESRKDEDRASQPKAAEQAAEAQGSFYVVRESYDAANRTTRVQYVGPFVSHQEAYVWRYSGGEWYNRDSPIKQIANIEAILGSEDVVTAVSTKGSR